jgi:hypothetical protein
MKKIKSFFVNNLLLLFIVINTNAQINLNSTTITRFKKFEATITVNGLSLSSAQKNLINGSTLNNFDKNQIYLEATFSNGGTTKIVNGFYYEDYSITNAYHPDTSVCTFPNIKVQTLNPSGNFSWKVRFTPTIIGTWTVNLTFKFPNSSNPNLTIYNGSITCTSETDPKSGFIYLDNSVFRYSDGTGFIPLGINVPNCPEWTPGGENSGTNMYDVYFKRLSEEGGNLARIFIDNFETLALIAPFPDNNFQYYNKFKLSSAYQLDKIVELAEFYKIKLQIVTSLYVLYNNGYWQTNPYNLNAKLNTWPHDPMLASHGDCNTPTEFLTKTSAKTNHKNLLRYIIDRWGYSPSIFSWELINEANLTTNDYTALENWHSEMANFMKSHEKYGRFVSTGYGGGTDFSTDLEKRIPITQNMDYYAMHRYITPNLPPNQDTNYPNGLIEDAKFKWFEEISNYKNYINKPFIMGEAGYIGDNWNKYELNDPKAFGYHQELWSTLFHGGYGPNIEWCFEAFIKRNSLTNESSDFMKCLRPISEYVKNIPKLDYKTQKSYRILSTNTNYTSDKLNVYYFIDNSINKVFGWAQDGNFSVEKLLGLNNLSSYYLTGNHPYLNDLSTNKPAYASTNFNFTIQLPSSGKYEVQWYNTETGLSYGTIETILSCGLELDLGMPTFLRNGKYADAAFIATKVGYGENEKDYLGISIPVKGNSRLQSDVSNKVIFTETSGKMAFTYFDGNNWVSGPTSATAPNLYSNTGFALKQDWTGSTYYAGSVNNVVNFYQLYYNNNTWLTNQLTNTNVSIKPNSEIKWNIDKGFYVRNDGYMSSFHNCNNTYWCVDWLNPSAPKVYSNTGFSIATSLNNSLIYAGVNASNQTDIYKLWWNTTWQFAKLTNTNNLNIRTDSKVLMGYQNTIGYYVRTDGYINAFYNCGQTYWCVAWITNPQNAVPVMPGTKIFVLPTFDGQVFYIGTDENIYRVYYNNGWLTELLTYDECPNTKQANTDLLVTSNHIYFTGSDNKIHNLSYLSSSGTQKQMQNTISPSYFPDYKNTTSFSNLPLEKKLKIIRPSNNSSIILVSTDIIKSAAVYDITGKLMLEKSNIENNFLEFSISQFTNGIYFVKTLHANGTAEINKISITN